MTEREPALPSLPPPVAEHLKALKLPLRQKMRWTPNRKQSFVLAAQSFPEYLHLLLQHYGITLAEYEHWEAGNTRVKDVKRRYF